MIALVTGGNRGLGKEVARQLAVKGHQVIITARNTEKGQQAQAELQEMTNNPNIHFVQLDVTKEQDVQNSYQYIEEKFGQLDVLVNNAGIFLDREDSTKVSLDNLNKTLDTNFYGPFRTSQAFLPLMRKAQEARIINVSSGMGALESMGGGHAAYRLSKTALNSLTAIMAADVAADGIKVFAVCPGWVHTDMGGKEAPRTPEEGGNSITYLVDAPDAVSGKFYRDGQIIPW